MNILLAKVGKSAINESNEDNDIPAGSIIGIAKDGHIIYGPQKRDKNQNTVELYNACEIDACNGLKYKVGETDYYKYVATTTHPYLVGCFGPTDNPTGSVQGQYCSSNPKVCGGLSGFATAFTSSLLALIALSLL